MESIREFLINKIGEKHLVDEILKEYYMDKMKDVFNELEEVMSYRALPIISPHSPYNCMEEIFQARCGLYFS